MSRNLEAFDERARIHAYKVFKEGVSRGWWEDSPENLREFVNGLGQYNSALQSDSVRFLRGTGINRFATAATTFGIKTPIEMAQMSPGAKATSTVNDLKGRAIVAGRLMGVLVTVAAINGALNKKEDGTPNWFPEDMPLGAVGVSDKKYFDLLELTGWGRTFRNTGIRSTVEGARQGQPPERIAKKAIQDVAASATAPAFGPPIQDIGHALIGRPVTIKDIRPSATARPGFLGRAEYVAEGATPLAKAGAALVKGEGKSLVESQLPFIATKTRKEPNIKGQDWVEGQADMTWLVDEAKAKFESPRERQQYILSEIKKLPREERVVYMRIYAKNVRKLQKP
jgi:hypothetical protein